MIIYIPSWLEYAYLNTFSKKRICYNSYENVLLSEDEEIVFIKNMVKNYEIYIENKNIIVIFNILPHNIPHIQEITAYDVICMMCTKLDHPYDKKILQFCEKYEVCPFITILNLSLGGEYPPVHKKEIIPMENTISTSKYLQSSLWFYFLNQKSSTVFKTYSHEKCLYFYNIFITLENDFGFINEELSHIFLLPILSFSH
jgi:hypothetical protein